MEDKLFIEKLNFYNKFGNEQQSKINEISKIENYESFKNIAQKLFNDLKSSQKEFLKYYGTFPDDLSFLWLYFTVNIFPFIKELNEEIELFIENEGKYYKYLSEYKTIFYEIFRGFSILYNFSNKILENLVEDDDITEVEREIFDIILKIPCDISYTTLTEKEQNIVSVMLNNGDDVNGIKE